jgi:hypothetical protein
MTYDLRQQGGSFLILECNPEAASRLQAERIVAVCGNADDAGRVLAGLWLLEAGGK